MRLRKNLVNVHHAANVAGVKHGDFWDAIEALGFKTHGYSLDRKDIRAVLRKLHVRAKDEQTKDSIRNAIHVFADEPEEDERK